MVSVSVPATTANLAAGFDCIGLALSLRATVTFERRASGFRVTGCDGAYAGEHNAAVAAFKTALARRGASLPGAAVHIDSPIPIARGLGSSAALVCAGVAAAGVLSGRPFSREETVDVAAAIEGHPDNAAPAVFGGLRLSVTQGDKVVSVPCAVHESLRFLALIPDFELPTAAARAVLPGSVSRADAVHGIGRAALLLRALETGDETLLPLALDDRLHQPYRLPLIAQGERVLALAHSLGCRGCFISGSGPTLMCVGRDAAFPARMAQALRALPGGWRAVPLDVDHEGICVQVS